MSDYITTYTKVHFTPLDPKVEEIKIEDIAHALSLMTRANGHFPEFYSVGQHCIACCKEAMVRGMSDRVALMCLIHDAGEAYLSDVTRPVKKNMTFYQQVEEKLLDAIYIRFLHDAPTGEELLQVKEMDDTLLYHEFYHYMGEYIMERKTTLVSGEDFRVRPFEEVEQEYLALFRQLYRE